MILRIDHVGLVTADLAAAASSLALLDLKHTYADDVPAYGVATSFWQCPGDTTSIELVAPARPDAAVHGHLARLGPGLNHVAFEVDDIDADLAALQDRGAILVDETPCQGGRPGLRVAFAHLGPATGLLVELVDYGR
ncbi:methylmalonyl-CoA mutase, C-terminal domain/methylmalonyl-CoA/ethylmalonyl-CoA epimerase [Lentzea fradiae]|uniref:Methylmalonyl-CoA mutase, C-terminal domain/methylmalonyl-CoA/ethylmalonyl-CoA epimerase n=1 Tax=Lentzea fradiae TaxID=200378 RepID=A0A1G7R786_9PSEU|nr:VOC family protein [Lentzea fradiae]SDG06642.1 methylmalonyl-CoA mutase, C-terminal domain/methylmalonyl-CoA/ethylmalonyl-CoA epimerase [Lentzea fradiae]